MILAVLCLVLAAFPLLLALDNLAQLRTPAPRGGASISVLIPARDEALTIGAAVTALLASTGVTLDLCVLDDGSTDGTADVLAGIADARLRVLRGAPLPPGWCGKMHACAQLAQAARHDLMVFVDADVRLAPDALSRLAGFMAARPKVALASGFPRQITGSWAEWLLLPFMHVLAMGYLPLRGMRASNRPGFGAGCGQLMVARRGAYQACGGHAAVARSLHDGLALPRLFRAHGLGTDLVAVSAFAACRMYANAGEVFRGLLKNAAEGMATPAGLPVWTMLLAGGHVLPFLLLPFLLSAAAPLPGRLAIGACACSLGLRAVLAVRYRHDWRSVLCHPAGVVVLLGVQWVALIRRWRGVPAEWRGRRYAP